MSEEANKSLLSQIFNDRAKKEREAVKGRLGKLVEDRANALAVLQGVEDKIVEELSSIGENEEEIRRFLAGA